MSTTKRAALFVLILFSLRCVSVASRLRPAWSPGWSEIAIQSQTDARSSNLEVRTFFDAQTLPGAEITAERLTKQAPNETGKTPSEITNGEGVASFSLHPGTWLIRADISGINA